MLQRLKEIAKVTSVPIKQLMKKDSDDESEIEEIAQIENKQIGKEK